MNNISLIALTWIGVAVHAAVGVAALRRWSSLPLVPVLNMVVAVCILAYWVPKWYGYAAKGIHWYASDQLVPFYAVLVCALAVLTLTGRYSGTVPHWLVFGMDALVLLVAALFFTFFRMDRMM